MGNTGPMNNLVNLNDYSSPFQLDLSIHEHSLSSSKNRAVVIEKPFVPAENSTQYNPNSLDYSNKHLRKALTQKNSVLFESFEFYITGKYTMNAKN